MTDDYTGVLTEDDLKKATTAMAAPTPPGVAPPPDIAPPAVSSATAPMPAAVPQGAQPVAPYQAPMPPSIATPPPPPPKWSDYAPASPHTFSGKLTRALGDMFTGEPQKQQERAQVAYTAATHEWQEGQLVPVMTPQGQTVFLPPASAEKMLQTQEQQKGAGERTAATVTGREAVADTGAQSREKVAETNKTAREDVANTAAGAREETARINVGGKSLGTKTIEVGGKPHVMMWNPDTHTYDRDLGEAPPPASATSAYANTRTATLLDPETGVPTVFQYNPQTNSYDKPVGFSAAGAFGGRASQAGAIERSGTDLIADINQRRDKVGNIGAIIESAFLGTPLADPEQSYLAARIGSFAALQPALHGFRGQSALKEFEKLIGGIPKDPDALIRAIQGIQTTAGEVLPPKPTGGATPPAGAKVISLDDFLKAK